MADQDSPFSITANVIGILTFVVAIAAAAYARVTYLRNGDEEYINVKTSLSWYKTESRWLADLAAGLRAQEDDGGDKKAPGWFAQSAEYQMYEFIMDDLLNLEQRLLDIVVDIEAKASTKAAASSVWTVVLSSGRPSVAVAWLAVRGKALELVRQREALTARVQFLHMSMISARLRDLEGRVRMGREEARDVWAGEVRKMREELDGGTRVNSFQLKEEH